MILLKVANNWKQLEMMIKSAVNDALNDEIAKEVKKLQQENVVETVYGAGTPEYYNRRDLTGGSLGDINMMVHDKPTNGVLEVKNIAKPSNRWRGRQYLVVPIEKGYADGKDWYSQPRRFIRDTREDLRAGKAVSALKRGLKKRLGSGSVV